MPNYCETDLYVMGPASDVAAALALIGCADGVDAFDFNAVVPYPDPFATMDRERAACGRDWRGEHEDEAKLAAYREKYGHESDGFNSGGCEWRREHWGTKWLPSEVSWDAKRGRLSFRTAWTCPAPVILALHKRFPSLSLFVEWFERGMADCGGFSVLASIDAEDRDLPAGKIVKEWHCRGYNGHRGG